MVDYNDGGNHTTIHQVYCFPFHYEQQKRITISAGNIALTITALLGNVLIIVALRKVSTLHSPSKLLLGCLASTDLGVGLISQPLSVAVLMLPKHSNLCFYVEILSNSIGAIFCGVSLLTLTAISVDRLLALLLGLRYRQVVTLRRVWVFVVAFWFSSAACTIIFFYNTRIGRGIVFIAGILCIVTITLCYTKIFFRLRQHQTQVQDLVLQGQANEGGILLNLKRYKKTVSSSLWIQMTTLVCYLPYSTATGIPAITGLSTPSIFLALSVTKTLLFFNSTLNPFLYCWKMREVRQAVNATIRKLCYSSS